MSHRSSPSNGKTARPTRAERGRHRDVLRAGLRMCAEAGKAEPTVADAVWELLIEAADTLKRLPDRERRWLASGTRSSWPQAIREYGETFAAAVGRGGRWEPMSAGLGPPSAGAIGRLETVMEWLVRARRAVVVARDERRLRARRRGSRSGDTPPPRRRPADGLRPP